MSHSRNVGSDLGLKPSGDKSGYLPVVALAVVIVSALGITVWQFLGGRDVAQAPDNATAEVPFQCMECGKEFTKGMLLYDEAGGAMPVDCPLCGGKQCAVAMQKCPKCRKYFLSEGMKAHVSYTLAVLKGGAPPDPPKVGDNICPKCHCNITEYWRQHARNLPGAKGK